VIVESPISAAVVPKTRIVLAGHPFAPIGMGEHLRCSFRAFQSVGANVGLKDIYGLQDPDTDLKKELQDNLVQDLSGDINIFHINGDEVDAALRHLGAAVPRDAYNVIYPMWELSRYPKEWADQLNRFDEIWAQSKFTFDSIAPAVAKPVVHMQQTGQIDLKSFLGRRYFKIPESAFTFLFFFDFTSYLQRKNPFAVLQAFEKLCSLRPAEDLCLVIKVKGGEEKSDDYQTFCDYVARSKGRLIVIDRLMTDNEIKNLVRCCDCFVSLHRSEGFGIGIINAMFLGKPVVCTAYSANLDFMTESNSCLVRYRLCEVPEGAYPFAEGQVWADADIDHAVEHMLKLSCERDCARAMGRQASRHIRVNFSYRATGLRYNERITEIIRNRASLRKAQT